MKEIIKIKTISEVHGIFGLAKPKHPLVSVIKIDDNITNFDSVMPSIPSIFIR